MNDAKRTKTSLSTFLFCENADFIGHFKETIFKKRHTVFITYR